MIVECPFRNIIISLTAHVMSNYTVYLYYLHKIYLARLLNHKRSTLH